MQNPEALLSRIKRNLARLYPRKATLQHVCEIIDRNWQVNDLEQKSRQATAFAQQIRQAENKPLLFVAISHGKFPTIDFLTESFRQSAQLQSFAIYLKQAPASCRQSACIELDFDLLLFAMILQLLPPGTPVYLQAHARSIFILPLIKAVNPQQLVIHEVYDWMECFIGEAEVFVAENIFSRREIDTMVQTEALTRNLSDLLLHKDDSPWTRQVLAQSSSPQLLYYPAPPRHWMKTPVTHDNSAPIRLVYTGQVMNPSVSSRVFGDLDLFPLIGSATTLDYRFTVFNSLLYQNTPAEMFSAYLDEAAANSCFDFHHGVDFPDILDHLHGHFDFGLIIFTPSDELVIGPNHLIGAMASKLFTYLAAGLPVLVSAQLEYMAQFVTRHGIGLVIQDFSDARELQQKIAGIDWTQLQQRIVQVQQDYAIERLAQQLLDFLDI
ncbi:MAG: hypothetical protein PVG66_09080 [Chromatiales bacterium]|jgi:hypothetical protein